MSDIATKLTTVAENQQKVYDAGHDKGVTDGRQAEWSDFWNNFFYTAAPFGTDYMFANWNMVNFKPDRHIRYNPVASSARYAFYGTYLKKTNSPTIAYDLVELLEQAGVSLYTAGLKNAYSMFQDSSVTRLPALDFSTVTSTTNAFTGCSKLHTIDKLKVSESTGSLGCFGGCTKLENLTIEGTIAKACLFSPCTALSHDSLMSIINALKTFTDGTTQKITIGATNIAKLTADEIDQIEAKGWTYA